MLAALVEGPAQLHVRSVHDPVMGPYDALCALEWGAVCSGTDRHIAEGSFPWPAKGPAILGHESCGRVIAVGDKVRHYRLGDLITRVSAPASARGEYGVIWGGFAEKGIAVDHQAMRADGLPEDQWKGHRVNRVLPAWVAPSTAPLFITWRETLSYSRRIGVSAGSSVLVVGSGGNGLAFIAHAKNLGATTVAAVGSAARAERARAAGATITADHRDPGAYRALAAALPQGFDVIIDSTGRTEVARQALPLLKDGGAYGQYGIDDIGKNEVDPGWARGTFRSVGSWDYDEAETHDEVLAMLDRKALDPAIWCDPATAVPLARIHEALAQAKAGAIKPLVRLSA
jgi:D-arabinose 1-dehydrogenase-like Zn-dependent alcohol dehydrogenase